MGRFGAHELVPLVLEIHDLPMICHTNFHCKLDMITFVAALLHTGL